MAFEPKRCAVIGAAGGLGSAFVDRLLERACVEKVYALGRSKALATDDARIVRDHIDYHDHQSIVVAGAKIAEQGPLDLVIVATGLLHAADGFGPEKSLRDLNPEALARSYLVNTIGPALVAKTFLPMLSRSSKSVFAAISARVGSISDNRMGGWYGYRSAKAGLNQILRTASIEHARRWPESVVIGLHPGTVDTDLSKPFQRNVAPGKLFTAEQSTRQMMTVIDNVSARDTGLVFAFDGSVVPA